MMTSESTQCFCSSPSSFLHCTNNSANPIISFCSFNLNSSTPPRRLLLRSSSSSSSSSAAVPLRAAVSLVTDESATPSTSGSDYVSRRLILLRHAHSSFSQPALLDHDRPLTVTGQSQAAKIAIELQQLGWIPRLILLSDAVRTRETLRIMQENVPAFLDAETRFIPSFYSIAAMDGQTADHLQRSVCEHSTNDILTVMCMGHNRGWEEAASMFTGITIELKTCNAALLEAAGNTWEEAFGLAGLGGWKLQGIVKPNTS